MEKLSFEPPASAPAHLALLAAASRHGLDADALRRLLWLVNAHPRLIAHAQTFRNIGSLLAQATFEPTALHWAGQWRADTAAWSDLCDWMDRDRTRLSHMARLDEFDRQPRRPDDHPHLHQGVTRHGIVAALWNTPQPNAEGQTSSRYLELQGHLLAACIESRYRLSTQAFYEEYDGERELPIAPIRSSAVSPAVREFSLASYAPIVGAFPIAPDTPTFATSLATFEPPLGALTARSPEHAQRVRVYVSAIRLYFQRFAQVLRGWTPPQARRRGWGGSGRKARHPGYVAYLPDSGVFEEAREVSGDPDIHRPAGQRIYVGGGGSSSAEDDLERSGVAPQEDLRPILELFTVEELRGRFLQLQRQRQALEARAQTLTFDYARLTPSELRAVWLTCCRSIDAYLQSPAPTPSDLRRAEAGLALQLSLTFGQPLETIRTLELDWLTPDSTISREPVDSIETAKPTPALIIESPTVGAFDGARVIGLRLPVIMPDYRSELPDELDDINRESADEFVLPERLGIGDKVLKFLRRRTGPPGNSWRFHPQILGSASALLGNLGSARLTHEKIARCLGAIITESSGDQTLAWITTAAQRMRNEPRMHYTRHRLDRVLDAHFKATLRLARLLELPPPRRPLGAADDPERHTWVGARFVMQRDAARELITSLVKGLSTRRMDREDLVRCVQYHNRFVLYTVLYQSLATSARATRSPDRLFRHWYETRAVDGDGIIAPLSDKDDASQSRARLALLPSGLARQFENLDAHVEYLRASTKFGAPIRHSSGGAGAFTLLRSAFESQELTPEWITAALNEWFGYPIPANWHRAFLRTELLARRCPVEAIDAFMGHSNLGESPFSPYSTFDYRRYRRIILERLADIHEDLGLVPVASRLIPFAKRGKAT
ncbi:MAG: hypothetical protein KDG55_00500 [Rhodocyclaceae bacterium]|nr:hypothetical protein [Rhodocyclaceae bacterium]